MFFWINFVSLIVMLVVLILTPLFMISFYPNYFNNWEDETFEIKWGAIFEGIRKDRLTSLFYPVYFILRRIIFAVMAVYLSNLLLA